MLAFISYLSLSSLFSKSSSKIVYVIIWYDTPVVYNGIAITHERFCARKIEFVYIHIWTVTRGRSEFAACLYIYSIRRHEGGFAFLPNSTLISHVLYASYQGTIHQWELISCLITIERDRHPSPNRLLPYAPNIGPDHRPSPNRLLPITPPLRWHIFYIYIHHSSLP